MNYINDVNAATTDNRISFCQRGCELKSAAQCNSDARLTIGSDVYSTSNLDNDASTEWGSRHSPWACRDRGASFYNSITSDDIMDQPYTFE